MSAPTFKQGKLNILTQRHSFQVSGVIAAIDQNQYATLLYRQVVGSRLDLALPFGGFMVDITHRYR
jgi:hypothetical protein